ncbi:hypothetical protein VNO78_25216 [Psophocarpus tetragonolobus]|uniref:Uncharacterized protein n=1 Tax=Psophocarpus tetragonolobus TaxID=3891 RepID=A0AAN9S945_PSOTE
MTKEMVKRSPSQAKYGRVQFAIWLLVLVLFLGWIFIWIMRPTDIFGETWMSIYQANTNSTYFGAKVLLIAALGCLYLHICQKANDSNSYNARKREVTIWKPPVLMKGPLGIVSGTELAFLCSLHSYFGPL